MKALQRKILSPAIALVKRAFIEAGSMLHGKATVAMARHLAEAADLRSAAIAAANVDHQTTISFKSPRLL